MSEFFEAVNKALEALAAAKQMLWEGHVFLVIIPDWDVKC